MCREYFGVLWENLGGRWRISGILWKHFEVYRVYLGSTFEILSGPWGTREYFGSTLGVVESTLGVLWEYFGSILGVFFEYVLKNTQKPLK